MDDSNDNTAESLGALGFMFDEYHAKTEMKIKLHKDMQIRLKVIGTDPGHKQSGQYLWPAASDLSNYLIDEWGSIGSSYVWELGAGCGLSGITCSFLGASKVWLSDYDGGAIKLIQGNNTSLP